MPRPTYDLAKAKSTTPTKRRSDNIDEGNDHQPTKCNKLDVGTAGTLIK